MNIFEKAKATIKEKHRWTASEIVTLHQNGEGHVYIGEGAKDGSPELTLWYSQGNNRVYMQAGLLGGSGWLFTLTPEKYEKWVREAQAIVNAAKVRQERLEAIQDEGKPHNRYPPRKTGRAAMYK